MENLNAEQVKKALENWVKNYDGKVLDFVTLCNSLALINSQEQRIKELTEEVERSETAGGCKESVDNGFSPSVTELQRENERLRAQNETLEINNKDFKHRIYELSRDNEEWEHENKDLECDNYMLRERITEIKADTVRKMHSEIKERCIEGGIYPAFVASTIDQIEKEMLEGKK